MRNFLSAYNSPSPTATPSNSPTLLFIQHLQLALIFFSPLALKWVFGKSLDKPLDQPSLRHYGPHGRGLDSVYCIRPTDEGCSRGCLIPSSPCASEMESATTGKLLVLGSGAQELMLKNQHLIITLTAKVLKAWLLVASVGKLIRLGWFRLCVHAGWSQDRWAFYPLLERHLWWGEGQACRLYIVHSLYTYKTKTNFTLKFCNHFLHRDGTRHCGLFKFIFAPEPMDSDTHAIRP